MAFNRESLIAIIAVLILHGGLLAAALYSPVNTQPISEQPPAVQGVLISLPPAPVVNTPKPPPPKKVEPPKPKPIPKPKPLPKPKPVVPPPVEAPPTERSITQEKVEQPEIVEEVAQEQEPIELPEINETAPAEPVGAPAITPASHEAHGLHNPKPNYPSMSHRLNETGVVEVEVLVKVDGRVGDVRLKTSSGHKRLDDAAMRAVRNWRYQPAMQGNVAIEQWYAHDITFEIN